MKLSRILSVLLVLTMLVSLFAALTLSASAKTYSTSSNSGVRGEICTELSAGAKSYYTGSYTYANLSKQSGATLRTSLKSLMSNGHDKSSYDDCKDYAYKTDCEQNNGKVTLLYTGYQANQNDASATAPGWNREHVWPKSLGGFSTSGAGADLHHIRPDDVTTNADRGNKKYGEVSNGTASTATIVGANNAIGGYYNSSYYEPLDEVKGDVARICLYVYTRYYGDYSGTSNITNVFQSVDVMLAWCELDPVDTWEMGRNEVVENLQGNRNVFIDYPEYAWLLFDKEIPTDMVTPSGEAALSDPQYTVTAESNNTEYGTVSMVGKTITATPKTGYTVSGYTVSPEGAATVTQSGNTFTVSNVKADCTVTITFAPKTAATITYIVPNGVTVSGTTTSYVGDTVTLASVLGTPTGTEGYSFYGWAEKEIVDTTTAPSVQKAGASYTVKAAQTTFYGVFSYLDGTMTHYISNPCKHEQTHSETVEPTCTKDGAVNTVCDDCGAVVASTPIAKTGHEYGDTVIAPTCESKGYTLHTCKNCGESYKNTYVAALGHDYVSKVTKPATATEDGVRTYTCTRCDSSYTEVIPATGEDTVHDCPCDDYSDLDKTEWYHEGVDLMLNEGYMKGVGNGMFEPDGTTTRAMIVTILWRMEGEPAPKTANTFTDVEENLWYTDAITWAAENDVVKGVGDGKFDPDGKITREEMATILFRYAGSLGADVSKRAELSGFPDGGKTAAWATDAMQWAVAEKIINGSEGMLLPQGNATRAQVATILYRSLDLILKTD